MSLFWSIYLSGYVVALLYLTDLFIEHCIKNRINYQESLSDYKTLGVIILNSLGSWLAVWIYYNREKN